MLCIFNPCVHAQQEAIGRGTWYGVDTNFEKRHSIDLPLKYTSITVV